MISTSKIPYRCTKCGDTKIREYEEWEYPREYVDYCKCGGRYKIVR